MGVWKDLDISFQDMIRVFESGDFTEDDFIDDYETIRNIYSFEEILWKNGRLVEEIQRENILIILEDIYSSNMEKNQWADYKNLSEKLKLFLKLNGEDV